MDKKKIIILLAIIAAIAAFFILDLGRYLSLDYIKGSQQRFADLYAANPAAVIAGFFAIYVAVAALSFPGAAILTLGAGAIFGLVVGTIIVSFASSIGATIAFLVARFILGESVQKKFGQRMAEINKGVEKEGAFYLFTLRLVPLVPFFVINLLMGLTKMKTLTFYWVSQVGMFLGTVVFVNAGTQLAKIDSLKGILSPGLIGSFVLLGIFPIIAKKIVDAVKRRKVYARWNHVKPKSFDRNLIVIGAGAGGLVTALIGAAVKAKVTLVEAHKMGGDCLNFGCVPSKAIIKSAKLAHMMRHAEKYGLNATSPTFSFKAVMQRIHDIIAEIAPHDSVERFTGLGVDVLEGYAKIVNPWTVEIALNDGTKKTLTTRSIVIAAGAQPVVPPLPGIENSGYVTSDTLWDAFAKLDELPKRLVVLGGGPIGCELSQSFARLGSVVSQIEMGPRLLIREDEEVSDFAAKSLSADGVQVLTNHKALRFENMGGVKTLIVEHAGAEKRIEFDEVICAVGRIARLKGYGLEDLGIPTSRTVDTNEYLETLYPNIFAAGDVAGPYQFTHTASHQAWYAAVNALFGRFRTFRADYSVIPWTTFTDPEVAHVGHTVATATAAGIAFEIVRYDLGHLDRAVAEGANRGFVKLLVKPGKDTILGVTIVAAQAGELLAEFVLAMKHGLGLGKILGTIHAYPTMAEANKYAAGEWKKTNQPERLLKWVERYHRWRRR